MNLQNTVNNVIISKINLYELDPAHHRIRLSIFIKFFYQSINFDFFEKN